MEKGEGEGHMLIYNEMDTCCKVVDNKRVSLEVL